MAAEAGASGPTSLGFILAHLAAPYPPAGASPPSRRQWHDLEEHSARLEALPRLAAYLAGPQRLPRISPLLP